MSITLRKAEVNDLEIINKIYNQAVAQRFQTADLVPIEMHQRRTWFNGHDKERYVIIVVEVNGTVVGWSSLSKYREGRAALRNTAEISYYIDTSHQGKGLGTYLIKETIHAATNIGFNNLVAILLSSNDISIRLLRKFGFSEWGNIPKAAEIDGQQIDHLYYGCKIS